MKVKQSVEYEGKRIPLPFLIERETLKSDGGELGNSSGVVFSSGFGDGCYDVYAYTKDIEGWGNRVCKVEIVLIDPEDIN